MIEAVVLGASAGGGFPQWNSNAPACARARRGDPDVLPSTQASLAVSGDGAHWFLLNAAPDIARQIERTPRLHPRGGVRGSPIAGAILTGGEVDAIAGLLTLRERHRFDVRASASVIDILDENPIFSVLAPALVRRIAMPLDTPMALDMPDGAPSGLTAELFAVPGKVPLHKEAEAACDMFERTDASVGVAIGDGRATLLFVPGCAAVTAELRQRFAAADALFFDATLWRDDEMIAVGAGPKTARRMGHMPVTGEGGTFERLGDLAGPRRILIHINNTNPLHDRSSPEYAEARARGWDVAFDGMEITL